MDDIKLDFKKLFHHRPPKPQEDLPVLNEIPQDVELSRIMSSQHDLKQLYAATLDNKTEMGHNASILHAEIHKEDKKVFDELGGGLVKLDKSVSERLASLDEKIQNETAEAIKTVREEIDFKVNFINGEINRLTAALYDLNATVDAINEFGDVSGVATAVAEAVRKVEKLSTKIDEVKTTAEGIAANSDAIALLRSEIDTKFAATAEDVSKLKTDVANSAASISNFSSTVARAFGEFNERTNKSFESHGDSIAELFEKFFQLRTEVDILKNGTP